MDVTVVGSCNTDLISYVPRLPKPGETLHGRKFQIGLGGKGANQCVTSARLGAKTAMVAKIGKDTFGESFLRRFTEDGINTDFVSSTDEAMTGAAPILVDDSGQNSIVIVPGANLLLNEADLDAADSLIARSKVVVCQLEIQPAISLAALRLARKHNVKTIFNPAPAVRELDPEFYSLSDIFCPNETETEILTGCPVTGVEEARKASQVLLEKGCGSVVITMGKMGSVINVGAGHPPVHVPAPEVTVVDTTGAGDSFIGSLAYFLSTQPSMLLEEAVKRATQIASISVQRPGTQTSFPYRASLASALFE